MPLLQIMQQLHQDPHSIQVFRWIRSQLIEVRYFKLRLLNTIMSEFFVKAVQCLERSNAQDLLT